MKKGGSKASSSTTTGGSTTTNNTKSSSPTKSSTTTTTTRKTTTANTYWNAGSMRTYEPLTVGVHYRPVGAYIVYHSPYYGQTYYDGYGWNLYTDTAGYYDNTIGGEFIAILDIQRVIYKD